MAKLRPTWVLLFLFVFACSSSTDTDPPPTDTASSNDVVDPTDEGPAPTDEGPAPTDEGPAPTDEGPAPTDEGPAPTDEGPAPTDEGPAPTDEGPAPTDEGPAPTDEGLAPIDEGSALIDEGSAPIDEGPAPIDEGTPLIDEGTFPFDEGLADEGPLPVDEGTAPMDMATSDLIPMEDVATSNPCDEAGGSAAWSGDGYCDEDNNITECSWDGGDCCESTCVDGDYTCGGFTGFDFDCQDPEATDSTVNACPLAGGSLAEIDDGICNAANNNDSCEWDGGDCCQSTCDDETGTCGDVEYDCQDPDVLNSCEPDFSGDGWCDFINNNGDCGWDGGDCCESTCVDAEYTCGSNDFDCQDPDAPPPCVPVCDAECGFQIDGCGSPCPVLLCDVGLTCNDENQCVLGCVANCSDIQCGNFGDGCGGMCPSSECGEGQACNDTGQCEPVVCEPACPDFPSCIPIPPLPPIPDGCGGNCEVIICGDGEICTESGECEAAVMPMVGSAIISEYIEGSGNNKALEIFNASNWDLDCIVSKFVNGSPAAQPLSGLISLPVNGIYVLCNPSGSALGEAPCDESSGSLNFNGDDAISIGCVPAGESTDAIEIHDVLGVIGTDPGSEWTGGGLSTKDQTLRRDCVINEGDTDPLDDFDPSVGWVGFPKDTVDDLGHHCGFGTPPAPAGPTYTGQVQAIFQSKCSGCHSGGGSGGHDIASSLSSAQGSASSPQCVGMNDAACSVIRALDNTMPPFGTPVSAADKAILQQWLDAGMPE